MYFEQFHSHDEGKLNRYTLREYQIGLPSNRIISVVKNAETTIEKCIESVLNQNYKNIQYIIIDGNSTDYTK